MKVLVIGGSRGLGAALAKIEKQNGRDVTVVSRQSPSVEVDEHLAIDLSKAEQLETLWPRLGEFQRVYYAAGGGPFGEFAEQKWNSHRWALQVTFLSAAQILHRYLNQSTGEFVAIGSAIAEDRADPQASSYSASKWALRGLLESIAVEGGADRVALASPGYIDTDLLPPNSWPRQQGIPLWAPATLAAEIFHWLPQRQSWHRKFPNADADAAR